MPATKQRIHAAVDRLPESQIDAAYRVVVALSADPLSLAILAAPPDDEPYTLEQQRRDAESIAAIERGEGISTEELNRQLGL